MTSIRPVLDKHAWPWLPKPPKILDRALSAIAGIPPFHAIPPLDAETRFAGRGTSDVIDQEESFSPDIATPDDAEFQQWKAARKPAPSSPTAPVPDEAEFQAWKAKHAGGMTDLLKEQGIIRDPNAIHREYREGRLAKRMARENQNEREMEEATRTSIPQAVGNALLATQLNVGQSIPIVGGAMKAAQAGIASGVSRLPGMGGPRSYQQSLKDIESLTGQIPTGTKMLTQGVVGAGLAGMLPANPTAAGALMGYGSGALNPDLNQGLLERTAKGVGEGTVGAVAGNLLGKGTTMVRAGLAKTPQANLIQRQADRAESASRLYKAALAEGKANEATPALQSFLNEPDIAARVASLRELDQFSHLSPDDPRMLDALYKSMSDEAKTLQKGLGQIDPSKPNTGRFKLSDLRGKQKKLLGLLSSPGEKPPLTLDIAGETSVVPGKPFQTMEIPPERQMAARGEMVPEAYAPSRTAYGQGRPRVEITTPAMTVQTAPAEAVPPMMPSYRDAVQDFARRTDEMNALLKGVTANQAVSKATRPTARQMQSKEPKTAEAFDQWIQRATPAEKQAALEGILGDVKNAFGEPSKTLAPFRRAAGKGSSLARMVDVPDQHFVEMLQKLGLITGNASLGTP